MPSHGYPRAGLADVTSDRAIVAIIVVGLWLLLLVQLFTGRIYGRGCVWARREESPNQYWALLMVQAAFSAIISWFLLKAAFDPP